jgi:hypothetical protein
MLSQLDVREEADMTPINSLDTVLRAGLDAAQSQSRSVEGDKLADARAQVLQGTVKTQSTLLQPDHDRFSRDGHDPENTDDARLNRSLRALAEKFQAGQAAQAAVEDNPAEAAKTATTEQTDGRQLAYIGSWVGASTSSAPAPDPAPAPAPAVAPPPATGSSSDSSGSGSGSGTTSGGNGSNSPFWKWLHR